MVKVLPSQTDAIFQKLGDYNGILIYGQDYGMVGIRGNSVIKYFFPEGIDNFRYFDFQFDEIKDNEEKLLNSIKSISFVKGRKLIRIKGMASSIPLHIKKALDTVTKDEFILIIADDLPSSSSLRKYIEDSKNFLAVACYKMDTANIRARLQNFIRTRQIKLEGDESEIISYLENIFSLDSMLMESELEKLGVVGVNRPLSIELVQEIMGSSLEIRIDELIFAILDGRIKDALRYYDNVISEISEVGLTRYMLNYMVRILDIKLEAQKNGISINEAVKAQKPPIFFKLVPNYVKYSSNFSIKQIENYISKLNQAEFIAKSCSHIPIIFKNYILSIAKP